MTPNDVADAAMKAVPAIANALTVAYDEGQVDDVDVTTILNLLDQLEWPGRHDLRDSLVAMGYGRLSWIEQQAEATTDKKAP